MLGKSWMITNIYILLNVSTTLLMVLMFYNFGCTIRELGMVSAKHVDGVSLFQNVWMFSICYLMEVKALREFCSFFIPWVVLLECSRVLRALCSLFVWKIQWKKKLNKLDGLQIISLTANFYVQLARHLVIYSAFKCL